MADTENALPPSKKRAMGKELSKHNPRLDHCDGSTAGQQLGTSKKASDEVLASRKIVKIIRHTKPSSSNPFAGIHINPSGDMSIAAVTSYVMKLMNAREKCGYEGHGAVAENVEKEVGDGVQSNSTREGNSLRENEKESECLAESSRTIEVVSDVATEKETSAVKI